MFTLITDDFLRMRTRPHKRFFLLMFVLFHLLLLLLLFSILLIKKMKNFYNDHRYKPVNVIRFLKASFSQQHSIITVFFFFFFILFLFRNISISSFLSSFLSPIHLIKPFYGMKTLKMLCCQYDVYDIMIKCWFVG